MRNGLPFFPNKPLRFALARRTPERWKNTAASSREPQSPAFSHQRASSRRSRERRDRGTQPKKSRRAPWYTARKSKRKKRAEREGPISAHVMMPRCGAAATMNHPGTLIKRESFYYYRSFRCSCVFEVRALRVDGSTRAGIPSRIVDRSLILTHCLLIMLYIQISLGE